MPSPTQIMASPASLVIVCAAIGVVALLALLAIRFWAARWFVVPIGAVVIALAGSLVLLVTPRVTDVSSKSEFRDFIRKPQCLAEDAFVYKMRNGALKAFPIGKRTPSSIDDYLANRARWKRIVTYARRGAPIQATRVWKTYSPETFANVTRYEAEINRVRTDVTLLINRSHGSMPCARQ